MSNVTYKEIVSYWQDHRRQSENDYNRILSNFWLLSTCHSNNIEDGRLNYHVTREVFEGSTITMSNVYPRDIVEAQNSKFVRRKIVNNLLESKPLTQELIKSFHETYMNGLYDDRRFERGERPGKFKVNDYCVGLTGEGSAPENVANDISDLCTEVLGAGGNDILSVASYFHLVFESIHPFSDGNGRVGRLCTNYLLMLNNHPPINIFSEDKETYYMALEVYDRTGEISGFTKFLEEQCVKTWSSVLESVNKKVPSLNDALNKMAGE